MFLFLANILGFNVDMIGMYLSVYCILYYGTEYWVLQVQTM